MTTIALDHFPPAMQALFKLAIRDKEAVITENARPVARLVEVEAPVAGSPATVAPWGQSLEDIDPRFRPTAEDIAARRQPREFGFAKGLVIYMADDFNDPVDDFGDL